MAVGEYRMLIALVGLIELLLSFFSNRIAILLSRYRTRAFVTALGKLGVPMIVDDR
jgi:hypothetical protein